jgi:hypothetical protein
MGWGGKMKKREEWRAKLTLSCSAEGKEGIKLDAISNE